MICPVLNGQLGLLGLTQDRRLTTKGKYCGDCETLGDHKGIWGCSQN